VRGEKDVVVRGVRVLLEHRGHDVAAEVIVAPGGEVAGAEHFLVLNISARHGQNLCTEAEFTERAGHRVCGEARFVLWVPFYELAAAAGAFGPDQTAPDPGAASAWARVEGMRASKHMFALRVVGRSMEPRISDGAICLFRGGDALAGTRQGRIVLVALRDSVDPETAGRLTVKQYWSEKRFDEDGNLQHVRIELRPLNPDFAPIVITQAEEDSLRVLGEWVGVLGKS
jgi:SOS-response transcriptional repressor LexA